MTMVGTKYYLCAWCSQPYKRELAGNQILVNQDEFDRHNVGFASHGICGFCLAAERARLRAQGILKPGRINK